MSTYTLEGSKVEFIRLSHIFHVPASVFVAVMSSRIATTSTAFVPRNSLPLFAVCPLWLGVTLPAASLCCGASIISTTFPDTLSLSFIGGFPNSILGSLCLSGRRLLGPLAVVVQMNIFVAPRVMTMKIQRLFGG